jgi:hypothetical protein
MSDKVRGDIVPWQQWPMAQQRSLSGGPAGVLVLGAALAGAGDGVDPCLDVALLEAIEPLASEVWLDVEPGERLVCLVGQWCEVGLDDLA